MAQKAIHEYDGKRLLASHLGSYLPAGRSFNPPPALHVSPTSLGFRFDLTSGNQETPARDEVVKALGKLEGGNAWVTKSKVVVKPDQLVKRRGKGGLLLLNATWEDAKAWIADRMFQEIQVEKATGVLTHFIVEPFIAHEQEQEMYVCIQSVREGEEILFYHEGGVDVGDVDAKATRYLVPLAQDPVANCPLKAKNVTDNLLTNVKNDSVKDRVAEFIVALYKSYMSMHFVYLEINPLVVLDDQVDEAAAYLCLEKWGPMDFPTPFGRLPFPEEAYIKELDEKSGASLKLTILNPTGRIWTMVAGGGASVVYADTVTDLGFGHELANYGEYSGAPSEDLTFEYAKTILNLIDRHP
ncbi:ACLY, partial [Symbiodinium sp. KB8]